MTGSKNIFSALYSVSSDSTYKEEEEIEDDAFIPHIIAIML